MDWILLRDSNILPWERQDGPQILLSGRGLSGQVHREVGVKVRNIMKSLRQSLPQRCPAFTSNVPTNLQLVEIHLLAVLQHRRDGKGSLLVPAHDMAPDDDPGVHILALLTSQPGYNILKGRE